MVDVKRDEVARLAEKYPPDMVRFLRDMIAIPSESAGEQAVILRIKAEMEKVGFDEIKLDGFGNILGRIGAGKTVVALDAHVDTVGVGDPSTWKHDPYRGELDGGVIWGRGASDQEAGMAAMVYGAKILRELDLQGDTQLWVVGTVMEEDCDGLCWQYILREGVLAPDVVVSTEPTNLAVYRGHRGRMELEVRTQGRSCHGSAPERGINAVYKMAPIIADIEQLNDDLAATADGFLGKGSVTIAEIRSTSPSLCAVADSCTIHLDRRLTRGAEINKAGDAFVLGKPQRFARARVVGRPFREPAACKSHSVRGKKQRKASRGGGELLLAARNTPADVAVRRRQADPSLHPQGCHGEAAPAVP